jgi:hypothetical protein
MMFYQATMLAASVSLLFSSLTASPTASVGGTAGDSRETVVYVVIAKVDDLGHAEARALVLRHPTATPQNYILVTPNTTPADVARAVTVLQNSVRVHGNEFAREMRAPVGAGRERATGENVREAARQLHLLNSASGYQIPGFGVRPGLLTTVRVSLSS